MAIGAEITEEMEDNSIGITKFDSNNRMIFKSPPIDKPRKTILFKASIPIGLLFENVMNELERKSSILESVHLSTVKGVGRPRRKDWHFDWKGGREIPRRTEAVMKDFAQKVRDVFIPEIQSFKTFIIPLLKSRMEKEIGRAHV